MLWVVNGLSVPSIFADFDNYLKTLPPQEISVQEQEFTCAGGCDDANPCTRDVCVNAACEHLATGEGLSCGNNLTCQKGECRGAPLIPQIVLPEIKIPQFRDFVATGIAVTVLSAWALVSLFFVFYRRRRGHPWGLGNRRW